MSVVCREIRRTDPASCRENYEKGTEFHIFRQTVCVKSVIHDWSIAAAFNPTWPVINNPSRAKSPKINLLLFDERWEFKLTYSKK